ncbi:hypothetical protein ACFLY6_03040 [Candidatus Dependentiae bacterium]
MLKLLFLEIIFTIFSCIVLAYISMATAVGPWIAPTLILLAQLIPWQNYTRSNGKFRELILSQTAGSLGGIISAGIGFTLPMLFFINQKQFFAMLSSPLTFAVTLGSITLVAGGLGSFLGRIFAPIFLRDKSLSFPVSKMITETATQAQEGHTSNLLKGIFGSWGTIFLREGLTLNSIFSFPALIGKKALFLGYPMIPKIFPLSLTPTLWAIGWVAGLGMALPLFVGLLSKYLVLYPLNNHLSWTGLSLFPKMGEIEFASAFCSGIILFEVGTSTLRQIACSNLRQLFFPLSNLKNGLNSFFSFLSIKGDGHFLEKIEPWAVVVTSILFLWWLGVPFIVSIFVPLACAAATYHIGYFGGRTGLAPFGRFITLFAMLPAALIFTVKTLPMTYLCTFTAICLAAAVNLIFQLKVGKLASIEDTAIRKHHWIGLLLSALFVGLCFWLLLSNLKLGSTELFAHRAKARALLLNSLSFHPTVLFLGGVFGAVIKLLKLSPIMIFGGILMPNELTMGLFAGAMSSKLVRDPDKHRIFWTGIFAGESLWVTFMLLLRVIF